MSSKGRVKKRAVGMQDKAFVILLALLAVLLFFALWFVRPYADFLTTQTFTHGGRNHEHNGAFTIFTHNVSNSMRDLEGTTDGDDLYRNPRRHTPEGDHSTVPSKYYPGPYHDSPNRHFVFDSQDWPANHWHGNSKMWDDNGHKPSTSKDRGWENDHTYGASRLWPRNHRGNRSRGWPDGGPVWVPGHRAQATINTNPGREHTARASNTWPRNHTDAKSDVWPPNHQNNVSRRWPHQRHHDDILSVYWPRNHWSANSARRDDWEPDSHEPNFSRRSRNGELKPSPSPTSNRR